MDFVVEVDAGLPSGAILASRVYASDSDSPRNSVQASTAVPFLDRNPGVSLDFAFDAQTSTATYTLINGTGQAIPEARVWFTMPRGVRSATNSSIREGEPQVWDLLNVVTGTPQAFEAPLNILTSQPLGQLYAFAGGVWTGTGNGAFRRSVLARTDNLFAVETSPLNPAIRSIWNDAERREEVWVRSTWYGWFRDAFWPWILHSEHGAQYPRLAGDHRYFHDASLGAWIHIERSSYFRDPHFGVMHILKGDRKIPVSVIRGTVAPNRWFFHYGDGYQRPVREAEMRAMLDRPDE